jgi:hypothetical protein
LLGGSAKLAEDTLHDLKRFYPTISPRATIYFADADEHLEWAHDYGGLVKMAYGMDRISTMYQSQGDVLSSAVVGPLVFQVRNGHLLNETEFSRTNSAKLITFGDSDLQLRLSTADVIAGQGRYALKVDRLLNKPIQVAYTVNDGPLQTFTTTLDAVGEVSFDVSRDTKPGVYKFWAFKTATEDSWIRADQTLRVR